PEPEPQERVDSTVITFNKRVGNYYVEEVYDFGALERLSLLRLTEDGGIQGMSRESFSLLQHTTGLKEAFEQHAAKGGKMTPNDIIPARTKFKLMPKGSQHDE
ncbi:MAG: hypothetical protein OXT65_08905, partial [Alphaproteobacteria bacterium]|nr:hypothetical protein [Alphaproteobacteria bacterium]